MDIQSIEKAELHCHIDGIASPSHVEVLQNRGHFDGLDLDGLRKRLPVNSLDEWLEYSACLHPYQQNNGELLLEVLKLYLHDLVSQNVKLSEIMLSSFLFQYEDIERTFVQFQKFNAAAKSMSDIEVGFLVAIGRSKNRERVEGQIERICRLFDEGLVHGFALAGDENACTVREHADLFQILSDKGIPVEIHAGEWCGPESVWDAIEYGHPRRIGHGLSIFEDQSLLDQVLKQNIHIEFSPTSNAKLTDHRDIPKHPIIQARECEMNYSINTDDPGPFECSMHSECQMLADKLGFTAAELNRVYANSVDASFVSERQM